ncbi:hypothetical protein [Metabacillus sp. FJAT-53654]|uniref:MarR family transcriptional regulator n=1 Tax=Metabacillus rhizosphaerae TaxID=3117747 RepID=A0ABZ2N015_9BACI
MEKEIFNLLKSDTKPLNFREISRRLNYKEIEVLKVLNRRDQRKIKMVDMFDDGAKINSTYYTV